MNTTNITAADTLSIQDFATRTAAVEIVAMRDNLSIFEVTFQSLDLNDAGSRDKFTREVPAKSEAEARALAEAWADGAEVVEIEETSALSA